MKLFAVLIFMGGAALLLSIDWRIPLGAFLMMWGNAILWEDDE